MTEMDKINHAARVGVLHHWQLCYLWALEFWDTNGILPKGEAVVSGVMERYRPKCRFDVDCAYVALKMLRATLPKKPNAQKTA